MGSIEHATFEGPNNGCVSVKETCKLVVLLLPFRQMTHKTRTLPPIQMEPELRVSLAKEPGPGPAASGLSGEV